MNPSIINILQWNVVSLSNMKLKEITTFISRYEVVIIFLKETKLHNMRKIQIKGIETYRKGRSTGRKRSGIALMIRKQIPHSLVAPKRYILTKLKQL